MLITGNTLRIIWNEINKTVDKFIPSGAILKPNEKIPRNDGEFFEYMLNNHSSNIRILKNLVKDK